MNANEAASDDRQELAAAIADLQAVAQHSDIAQAGSDAVGILLQFLVAQGYDELVDAYEEAIDHLSLRVKNAGYPAEPG
jgi:hypothetical protein